MDEVFDTMRVADAVVELGTLAAVGVAAVVLQMRRSCWPRRARGSMSQRAEMVPLQARPDCDPWGEWIYWTGRSSTMDVLGWLMCDV